MVMVTVTGCMGMVCLWIWADWLIGLSVDRLVGGDVYLVQHSGVWA